MEDHNGDYLFLNCGDWLKMVKCSLHLKKDKVKKIQNHDF